MVSADSPQHFKMFKTLVVAPMNSKNQLGSSLNPERETKKGKTSSSNKRFNPQRNYFNVSEQNPQPDKKN